MILAWRRAGKVGRCRVQKDGPDLKKSGSLIFLLSSAVEHPAVNRRVVSSNLTGGAMIADEKAAK